MADAAPFHQLLTPVADNLGLSFIVAALPIATVLAILGLLRRPAWQASAAGLIVAFLLAALVWRLPVRLALDSVAAGAVFALWPVMWIVFNALVLYNIAVQSGQFDAFRRWVVLSLPNDRRIVLVVIAFCFGALLEGIAGFGAPIAITSALLIALGFRPIDALVFTLLFNTAPVAFGALGVPVATLGAVTGLSDRVLAAMVGRQLPVIAVILPFYVIFIYGGMRSIRALWPVLLVAGGSFGLAQFVSSNFLSYEPTDVFSALGALLATLGFLKLWRPAPDPEFALAPMSEDSASAHPAWQGWLPWILVTATVILWTSFKVNLVGQTKLPWPGLDKAVFITLYNQPYAAVWSFQPLATGTAILVAALITALAFGQGLGGWLRAARASWVRQGWRS